DTPVRRVQRSPDRANARSGPASRARGAEAARVLAFARALHPAVRRGGQLRQALQRRGAPRPRHLLGIPVAGLRAEDPLHGCVPRAESGLGAALARRAAIARDRSLRELAGQRDPGALAAERLAVQAEAAPADFQAGGRPERPGAPIRATA